MYETDGKESFMGPDTEGIDTSRNCLREGKMTEGWLPEQIQKSNNYADNSCEIGLIHVVQPGDTLYHLSRKYHVSVSEIMYKNPYANVYHLCPGDELCIPVLAERL